MPIPEEFSCPDTSRYVKARAYSELEYRIHSLELRMEFYLWLVKNFCTAGGCVFSGFAGGKLTCAAMVRTPLPISATSADLHYTCCFFRLLFLLQCREGISSARVALNRVSSSLDSNALSLADVIC